ncbi:MAG: arylsulfotransferase family protein [Promethearchaeota archaeon]
MKKVLNKRFKKSFTLKISLLMIFTLTSSILRINAFKSRTPDGLYSTISGEENNELIDPFFNFIQENKNDTNVNCSIQYTIPSGVVDNGSIMYFYSKDHGSTFTPVDARDDPFNNSKIDTFWTFLNKDSGTIIESNAKLNIKDDGMHDWIGRVGQPPRKDAPAIIQETWNDFNASVLLNSSSINGLWEKAGILLQTNNMMMSFHVQINSEGDKVIGIYISQKGYILKLFEEKIANSSIGWINLNLERRKDDFYFRFSDSPSGLDSRLLMKKSLLVNQTAQVGLFSSLGASASFSNWSISPNIDIDIFSNTSGLIKAQEIPFSKFDSDNYIHFYINSTGGDAYSNDYQVRIDASSGNVKFREVTPLNTNDVTPNVKVYMSALDIGYFAEKIDKDSIYFGYQKDGRRPTHFINPHDDSFYSMNNVTDSLSRYWKVTNKPNLKVKIDPSAGLCNLSDSNNSRWDNKIKTAPLVTQEMHGDFQITAKLLFEDGIYSSGGIIVVINDTTYYSLKVKHLDGSKVLLNATISINNIITETFSSSINYIKEPAIWLRILRQNDEWAFSYSLSGGSYNIFYTMVKASINVDENFQIGLVVEDNSTLIVDSWEVSPSICFKFEMGGLPKYYFGIYDIPFNQYSRDYNTLQLKIQDIENVTSFSNVFYINITSRDFTGTSILLSEQDMINLLDDNGDIKWSIYNPNTLDVEMLQSGDVLATSGLPGSGHVRIININNTVIRDLISVGGIPLSWPHDADMLPNGNILIADTGNNRAVEINENNEVIWQWTPFKHFLECDFPKEGGAHLNDVDRLSNGNTLISLRNLDTIVEVNQEGEIVWQYGEPGSGLLNHPHNPDRLLNGDTIICDSENNRIIQVTKEHKINWIFKPVDDNGNPMLGWPRDADVLPNGMILISDTQVNGHGKNGIFMVDRETKEFRWELESSGPVYDADVVITNEPEIKILLPINTTYNSRLIEVYMNASSPFVNTYYMVHDKNTGQDIFGKPREYLGRTDILLESGHSYTLTAWANSSGDLGGGSPQDDSISITTTKTTNISFNIDLESEVSSSRPALPFNGLVLLTSDNPASLIEVDPLMNVIWKYEFPIPDVKKVIFSTVLGVDVMPNGHLLSCLNVVYENFTMVSRVIESDHDGKIFWQYSDFISGDAVIGGGYHDVDYLPGSDSFIIADTNRERVIEVNRTGDITWSWYPKDYYPVEGNESDIYHLNDVDRLPDGNTLISLRNLNMIVEVDKRGFVVWTLGGPYYSNFLGKQHNPLRLTNGNTMICDSGNNRIIEVDKNGNIVWSTQDFPNITLNFPRGVEYLPNGNLLISDSLNNRDLVIDKQGNILWEYDDAELAYDADFTSFQKPYIEIVPNNALSRGNNHEGTPLSFKINVFTINASKIHYEIFSESVENNLILSGVVEDNNSLVELPDLSPGNYVIRAWYSDNYSSVFMATSDHLPRTGESFYKFTIEEQAQLKLLGGLVSTLSIVGTIGIITYIHQKNSHGKVRFHARNLLKLNRSSKIHGDDELENEKYKDEIDSLKLDFDN